VATCGELGYAEGNYCRIQRKWPGSIEIYVHVTEKFDKPNGYWLKCIEATSDELLGFYSNAEDDALSAAFGDRGKKRLNRVFDAIVFVYPDYHYPL
jgi:hypothetical protein